EEPKREILSEKNNINYDTTQYSYANEKVIEDIKLPPTYHRKRENKADIEENISSKKTKCETNDPNAENLQLRNNSENFSFEFFPPSDNINKELEDNDEEIKFDLKNISIELKREPKAKISSSLRDTAGRHLVGGDVFMDSEKDTAHDGFDFSDVPSYADAKLIQEEESLSKLETVYQHYLMKKLDIFVSKYPSMQLKHVDTHQKPILKGQKPDIIFYLQDRAISNINIVSVLEIKVTEKEDEWVKATSLAELSVLTENNDTYFYITGILPFRKVGSHYLAHFCLSTSELLGFSLPTIKYQEKIFEATEILGTGATSTAYLLGNDYVLKGGGVINIPCYVGCGKTSKTSANFILMSGVG
ncbi:1926_t:CDS:2, partial [Entrophospora sp. SA101]